MDTFIYAIKNTENGKLYVGSTKTFALRKAHHFCLLRKNKHYNKHLQRSVNLTGLEKFEFILLEICDSKQRKLRELHYININQTQNSKFGYNNHEPNESNSHFQCKDSTKENIKRSEYHKNLLIKIDMYTIEGVFISTYNSIKECAKNYGWYSATISNIILGSRKSYKGYTFVRSGDPFVYTPSSKQRNMSKYYKKKQITPADLTRS